MVYKKEIESGWVKVVSIYAKRKPRWLSKFEKVDTFSVVSI